MCIIVKTMFVFADVGIVFCALNGKREQLDSKGLVLEWEGGSFLIYRLVIIGLSTG